MKNNATHTHALDGGARGGGDGLGYGHARLRGPELYRSLGGASIELLQRGAGAAGLPRAEVASKP